ncbi:MAG: hypothetical protein WCK31_00220 [bacterium]
MEQANHTNGSINNENQTSKDAELGRGNIDDRSREPLILEQLRKSGIQHIEIALKVVSFIEKSLLDSSNYQFQESDGKFIKLICDDPYTDPIELLVKVKKVKEIFTDFPINSKKDGELNLEDIITIAEVVKYRNYFEVFKYTIEESIVGQYKILTAHEFVKNISLKFLAVVKTYPEIITGFNTGLNLISILRFKLADKTEDVFSKISSSIVSMKSKLTDPSTCRNARIASKYGFRCPLVRSFDLNSSYEMWRIDQDSLEKSLLAWSLVREYYGYSGDNANSRITSEQQFFENYIWENSKKIMTYSTEDIQNTFSLLKRKPNSNFTIISFENLIKGTENIDAIQKRIQTAISEEYQNLIRDYSLERMFTDLAGIQEFDEEKFDETHSFYDSKNLFDSVATSTKKRVHERFVINSLDQFEDLKDVIKNKEQVIKKIDLLKSNGIKSVEISISSCKRLLSLSDDEIISINGLHVSNREKNISITENSLQNAISILKIEQNKRKVLFSFTSNLDLSLSRLLKSNNGLFEAVLSLKELPDLEIERTYQYLEAINSEFLLILSQNPAEEILLLKKILSNETNRERINKYFEHYKYNSNKDIKPVGQNIVALLNLYKAKSSDPNFKLIDYIKDNGYPSEIFLEEVIDFEHLYLIKRYLTTEVLADLESKEKLLWSRINKENNSEIVKLLIKHKDKIDELYIDDKPAKKFLTIIANENPQYFAGKANKYWWVQVVGGKEISNFLEVLPTYKNDFDNTSNERRNAFTNNEYDRTSELIKYLLRNCPIDFNINTNGIIELTGYVREFGLAQSEVLYHYYINLIKKGNNPEYELPQDIQESKILTIEDLQNRIKNLKNSLFSTNQLMGVSEFSKFEISLLKVISGYSTHRFLDGRPELELIIDEFTENAKDGEITPFPEEYTSEAIELDRIEIEFDINPALVDYNTLKEEILFCIEKEEPILEIRNKMLLKFQTKLSKLKNRVAISTPEVVVYINKDIIELESYITSLNSAKTTDELMGFMFDKKFNITGVKQSEIQSYMREIVLLKVLDGHFTSEQLFNLEHLLKAEVSADAILKIVNIIDEFAKTHILNIENNNKEGNWENEIFTKILENGNKTIKIFNPHIGKLRKVVSEFKTIKLDKEMSIQIIPDRGIVGELSAYLADVCYSEEYPLLLNRPNLTPYKFVSKDELTGELKFIGSVLVFEVDDINGNPSLLIRAFDVPKEDEIDIATFIEKVINQIAIVGKKRNKTQILVTGESHTISNYEMTIKHITDKYVKDKSEVSLDKTFDFNEYNVTDNCFIARII